MDSPLISVVIPTLGRDTLFATLDSIPTDPDIEVIVVADGAAAYELARPQINRRVVFLYNPVWDDRIGHPQREHGMSVATGKWLSFMDDDDTYTPEAFLAFREAIAASPGPHIFRMRYWHGEILWGNPSLVRGNVGTPMFLCRNDGLGEWKPERTGDFDFIHSTCLNQGPPTWNETIVCLVRPHEEGTVSGSHRSRAQKRHR